MRVYISGPIAGYPNGNKEEFTKYANLVKGYGHTPVNPHDLDHEHEGACLGDVVVRHTDDRCPRCESPDPKKHPAMQLEGEVQPCPDPWHVEHRYGCYMKADLLALLTCEAALFMPGWRRSRGATSERGVAEICGITIIEHYDIHQHKAARS